MANLTWPLMSLLQAKAIVVPTDDSEVKVCLRAQGEPICEWWGVVGAITIMCCNGNQACLERILPTVVRD